MTAASPRLDGRHAPACPRGCDGVTAALPRRDRGHAPACLPSRHANIAVLPRHARRHDAACRQHDAAKPQSCTSRTTLMPTHACGHAAAPRPSCGQERPACLRMPPVLSLQDSLPSSPRSQPIEGQVAPSRTRPIAMAHIPTPAAYQLPRSTLRFVVVNHREHRVDLVRRHLRCLGQTTRIGSMTSASPRFGACLSSLQTAAARCQTCTPEEHLRSPSRSDLSHPSKESVFPTSRSIDSTQPLSSTRHPPRTSASSSTPS